MAAGRLRSVLLASLRRRARHRVSPSHANGLGIRASGVSAHWGLALHDSLKRGCAHNAPPEAVLAYVAVHGRTAQRGVDSDGVKPSCVERSRLPN